MAGSASGRSDGDMAASSNESAIAEKTITRSSSISIAKDSSEISTLCHQCLAAYQELSENIRDLSADEAEDRGFDRDEKLVATQDSKSRLKAWAVNIAALQKGHVHSSLDFRLKDAIEIRQRIIKILKELDRTLHNASLIATGEKANRTWRVGYISDSEDDEEDDISENFPETSELDQLFSTMNATNTNLMKLSVIIRDSPTRDDYLKAASRYKFDPQYDISHVHEKYGSAKGSKDWLVQRLGKSITRRRQFLKYREEHHGKLARDWDAPEDEVKPEKTIAMTKATTFIGLKAAVGVFERPDGSESEELFGSQTSYDQTEMGETSVGKLIVPPPPTMAFESVPFQYGECFQCPYCYTEQKVKNRAAWKKHVFRDLRPYVCTFKECNMRMFRSRNEWFTHELQSHRRQWICVLCAKMFTSKNKFSAHLASTHHVTESDPQLNALILQSEEPVDSISSSACPFCNEWEDNMIHPKQDTKWGFLSDQKNTKPYGTLKQFRRHLGHHMEQLALFALPMADSGDLEDDSAGDDSDGSISVEDSEGVLGMLGETEEDIFKQPAESQSRTQALAEVIVAKKRIELIRILENENRSRDEFSLTPYATDNEAIVNHFLALCNILKDNFVETCSHIIDGDDQDIIDGSRSIATAEFQSQINSTLNGILRRDPKFWDLPKFQEQISSDQEITDSNLASSEPILKEQSSRLPLDEGALREYQNWCGNLKMEQLQEELAKWSQEIKILSLSPDNSGVEGGLNDAQQYNARQKSYIVKAILTERGAAKLAVGTMAELLKHEIPIRPAEVSGQSEKENKTGELPKDGRHFDEIRKRVTVLPRGTSNGKEYDFVFILDIKDREPPLKLPYNLSQNPSEVAFRFVEENQIPVTYLNQLINLIENSISNLSSSTQQPKASSEPVLEPFSSIYKELLQIKSSLRQMKDAGGASCLEEMELYGEKLDSITEMRVDGKFMVGQAFFPNGQDIINNLLAECRVLEEELFTSAAQKLIDEMDDEPTPVTPPKTYTDFLKFIPQEAAAESSSTDREKLSSMGAEDDFTSTDSFDNQGEILGDEDRVHDSSMQLNAESGSVEPPGIITGQGENRAQSNSGQNAKYSEGSATERPSLLGGIFAGGMPKLKKPSESDLNSLEFGNEIEEDGEKEASRNNGGVEVGSSKKARSAEGESKTRDKGKAVEEIVSVVREAKPVIIKTLSEELGELGERARGNFDDTTIRPPPSPLPSLPPRPPPLASETPGSAEALPSKSGDIPSRSEIIPPPRSVKVTVHDDKDHNATLRRLAGGVAGGVMLGAASSSGRGSGWYDQPESTASSRYGQQISQAANYHENVINDPVLMTAEPSRKEQKREVGNKSIKSRDDYTKFATARTTRSGSDNFDKNMTIKFTEKAPVIGGGTQIGYSHFEGRNANRVSCSYSTCQITFVDEKAMKKHREEAHKPSKSCPFEYCAPRYNSKRRWRLVQHFKDAHGLNEADATELGRKIENATPFDPDDQNNSLGLAGPSQTTNEQKNEETQMGVESTTHNFLGYGSDNTWDGYTNQVRITAGGPQVGYPLFEDIKANQQRKDKENPSTIATSRTANNRISCSYSTCQVTFADEKAMKKHREEAHKPSKSCPFEYCAPRYNSKRRWRLVQHFKEAHGLNEADATELGRKIENDTPFDADPGSENN